MVTNYGDGAFEVVWRNCVESNSVQLAINLLVQMYAKLFMRCLSLSSSAMSSPCPSMSTPVLQFQSSLLTVWSPLRAVSVLLLFGNVASRKTCGSRRGADVL